MFTAADRTALLAAFANASVTALLHGVEVHTFRAIVDDNVEVFSNFEEQQTMFKPELTALSSDITAIAGVQSFDILRDAETEVKRYAFDGKPTPDGAGLTRVFLAVKK